MGVNGVRCSSEELFGVERCSLDNADFLPKCSVVYLFIKYLYGRQELPEVM